MPARHELLVYLPVMLAVTLMPGPDMLFVLAQSARRGARVGIYSVAGIVSGGCVHITAAALGLSLLLAKSVVLFSLLKYAGAAYLVFLGARALLGREAAPVAVYAAARGSRRSAYVQGLITNVTNPKVVLFTLAFLPQFVTPARGSVGAQIALLGAIWFGTGALVLSGVACAAGWLEGLLRRSTRAQAVQRYLTGGILLGLGMSVALPDHR